MKDVKVSIFCLAYNHRDYIEDAIKGFLMQETQFPFQIVIHDDASTDGTTEIIQKYAARYPDLIIPIIQKENQYSKQPHGWINNYVRPYLSGTYVAQCEGDDYWTDKTKLQKQFDFMETHQEYSACTHGGKVLNESTKTFSDYHSFPFTGTITATQIILGDGALFLTNSIFYRKAAYRNHPYFKQICPIGDYPQIIWLALNGKIFYMDEIMSVYRVNAKGSWTTTNWHDANRRKTHCEKMQLSLEEADRYSNYKFHAEFLYSIGSIWIHFYKDFPKEKGSLREILSNEYYKKQSSRNKLSVLLNCYMPKLMKLLRKIRKIQ